jgi:hypothetical protein
MLVTTEHFNSLVLAQLTNPATGGVAGPLVGTSMLTFTGAPNLTPGMTLGTLTESTFTGYARVALTWGQLLMEADGSGKVLTQLADFRATASTVTEITTGYAVIDAATPTPNVLFAEMFPSPVNVTGAGEGISIVGSMGYDGADGGGATFVV